MTEIRKVKIIKDHKITLQKKTKKHAKSRGNTKENRNRTCADSASYGKKILFSGDSHIVTVKIHKLNNSFKQTNFLTNLQIKLPKEKQDIAVIRIRRNN